MASKTRETILYTYLSLLEKKEFDKITVTDLVEGCSISRQTFYYHFDDIDDMIKWAFNDEIEKALKASKDSPDWIEAIYNLIPMLEKYNIILTSVQKSHSLIGIQRHLTHCIYRFICEYYARNHNMKEANEKQLFAVKYTAAAIAGLIFMEMFYDEEFTYARVFDKVRNTFG